jgi:RHS repeat-associated protein
LASLSFDANGNMTVDEQGRTFIWDAWNRLVEVKQGSTTLVEYQYDGLKRRIVEDDGTDEKDLYYSDQWQVLEERVDGDTVTQYVWSAVYVDAMILRDRDADANTGNGLEERIYVLHDANYNVTALVDTSGNVLERYYYEAYGSAVYLDDAFALLPDAQSQFAWQRLHQGGRLDTITGNYHFRHRDLSPGLGRWISQDPIGFEAGDANLYRYVGNGSTNATDPSGLAPPRTPQGVPRAGGGHHPLPYEHWWNLNLSVDVQKIFNKVVPHQFPGGGSNSAAHMAYNARVGALMREWVERNGGPHNITPQMAAEFLESILNSSDPIIRGFLDRVNGPKDRMTRWFHEEATPYLEEEARQLGALNKAGRTSKWRMVGTVMTKTGKVFKVLAIGSTVMYLSQGGVLYAMEQSTKDFFFVDELSPHLVYAGEIVDGEYTYLKARFFRRISG